MDLLPHQLEDGLIMAEGDDALNWSGMGTGKTLTSLNAFRHAGHDRGLIIAPPIALTMWGETIPEFLGMSAQVLRTGAQKIKGEPDFLITTYALAVAAQQERLYEYFKGDTSHCMIMDEPQAIKGATSKRTLGLVGPDLDGDGGLVETFDQVFQLTGTPILRYYDDLYPQLRAFYPAVLKDYGVDTYDRWVLTFCVRQLKQFHPKMAPKMTIVGNKNKDVLKKLLNDCKPIRRKLKEVQEAMPPITQRRIDIDNADTRRLAKALAQKKIDVKKGLTDEDPELLKEWQDLYRARNRETASFIAEAAKEGPVLVGHWFRPSGAELVGALVSANLVVAEVNGSTPAKLRDKIRDSFNRGSIDVIVGQISSMSSSWNIQEASSRVIMAEDYFSPGMLSQFIHRIYRMGQGDHVQVDWVKSDHPIDDAITEVRERKEEDAGFVLDD